MSGREKFAKYNKTFEFIIRVVNVFPYKFRLWLFNFFRNTNGVKGLAIRYILLSTLSQSCGTNVSIHPGVYIKNPQKLVIGNNVSIHSLTYIEAYGGVIIGDDVSIAHNCSIVSTSHNYELKNISIKYQPIESRKVIIKNNVWVGCQSIFLYGSYVNSGSIIGAGSLVNKKFHEKNVIIVGTPAKVIKER